MGLIIETLSEAVSAFPHPVLAVALTDPLPATPQSTVMAAVPWPVATLPPDTIQVYVYPVLLVTEYGMPVLFSITVASPEIADVGNG